jgi:hypothetical protein
MYTTNLVDGGFIIISIKADVLFFCLKDPYVHFPVDSIVWFQVLCEYFLYSLLDISLQNFILSSAVDIPGKRQRAFKITGFVVLCKFRQVATLINQFRLSFFLFFCKCKQTFTNFKPL